jgi:PadR family transcriptional regulator, regulatory protein PadR
VSVDSPSKGDFRERKRRLTVESVGRVAFTYCVSYCSVPLMVLDDAFLKLESDLRRSVIVLATLSQLKAAQYGYSLRQTLAEHGMEIEEGTLYPLLRRLESQGFLTSEWRIEDGPPRRYYTLSAEGRRLYPKLVKSWRALTGVMEDLFEEGRTK